MVLKSMFLLSKMSPGGLRRGELQTNRDAADFIISVFNWEHVTGHSMGFKKQWMEQSKGPGHVFVQEVALENKGCYCSLHILTSSDIKIKFLHRTTQTRKGSLCLLGFPSIHTISYLVLAKTSKTFLST